MKRPLNKKLGYLKTAAYCLCAVGKERILKKRTPLAVVLYLTYRCNLKCPFCSFWRMKEEEMATSQVFSLIDQLKTCGTQRLGLTGGEATLRDDIGEIIEYSKSKGLITTLCSNGKIDEKKVPELKNLDVLILSLDGPRDIHDKLRGQGSYDDVIRTAVISKDLGIDVWLTTLLMKENVKSIEHTVNLAEKYNLRCSFQPAVHYSGSGDDIDSLLLNGDEVRSVFKKLIGYKRSGRPIALSRGYLEHVYKFWPGVNSRTLRCSAGRLFCMVSPAGYVFACQPREVNANVPNVLKSGFQEAFGSLPDYSCQSCFCDSFMETNLLFNMNFLTIKNMVENFILGQG